MNSSSCTIYVTSTVNTFWPEVVINYLFDVFTIFDTLSGNL